MSSPARRAIVIGGGIVGAASTYYLQRDGWDTTILEQHTFGSGCSHGNCGYVCPSHLLPLAEPGAVRATLRALVARNSPFAIRPRLDFRLWSWLWRFYRKCNTQDMLRGAAALHGLLNSSMSLFQELLAAEQLDCEWEQRGLLYVYRDRRLFDDYDRTNRLLTDSFHEPAEKLSAADAVRREPALKDEIAGAWFYEHDAHLRPDRLLSAWRRLLTGRGTQVVENCAVTGFVRRDERAVGVRTSHGELTADLFVVATGALTPLLSKALGCRIPIQPGKGYSLTMPRPQPCPAIPVIFPERRVAVTPFHSGFRLGSTMEFAGYDRSLRPARLQLLQDAAREYLRDPGREPIEEAWFGWRPMTYDSLPIIDRCPAMRNVLIAAGHNMLGVSMSNGTGKLIAELAGGREPHLDVKPFSVGRF